MMKQSLRILPELMEEDRVVHLGDGVGEDSLTGGVLSLRGGLGSFRLRSSVGVVGSLGGGVEFLGDAVGSSMEVVASSVGAVESLEGEVEFLGDAVRSSMEEAASLREGLGSSGG